MCNGFFLSEAEIVWWSINSRNRDYLKLLFTRDGIKHELCIKWEDFIKGYRKFQRGFLHYSANSKSSGVSEHKDYENQLAGESKKFGLDLDLDLFYEIYNTINEHNRRQTNYS